MASQSFGRGYPFPELEISRSCQNVSGAAIADKAVCKLIIGRNDDGVIADAQTSPYGTEAVTDSVAIGDSWPNYVTDINDSNYLGSNTNDGIWPVVGVNASGASLADDGKGKIVFVGQATLTLTPFASGQNGIPGDLVFLDASDSYKAKFTGLIADVGTGDVIFGRLAEFVTHNGTATLDVSCWIDGIHSCIYDVA